MPPKEYFTPIGKLYLKDEIGNLHVIDDMKIADIETIGDNSDSLSKLAMSSLANKFVLIFSNNRRRLHGQKPFRPRTYWKCVRYEIHRRSPDI